MCLVFGGRIGLFKSQPVCHEAINLARQNLKENINQGVQYQRYMTYPSQSEPNSLYTVIVVDKSLRKPLGDSGGAETGLCYTDEQVDRSPTSGGVAARVAYTVATGERSLGDSWAYHSLVSNALGSRSSFVGTALERVAELNDENIILAEPMRVRVGGHAIYVGSSTYVSVEEDPFGNDCFLSNHL